MSLLYFPLDGTDFRLSMGLQALRGRSWIDTDQNHGRDVAEKSRLIQDHRNQVFAETSGSLSAQHKILDLVRNEVAANHRNITPLASIKEEPSPLIQAALAVQEDLVLMRETDDGYILAAACVCFPTGWNLAEKVGKVMQTIHQPVPGLNPRLGKPIDRFFRKLRAGKQVERFNWGLYDSDALFQPGWWRRKRAVDTSINCHNVGEKIFFRVERQTLQRIDDDPDILFTIRIFNNSLAEVCEDRARAKRLLHGLQTMNADMRGYKSLPRYEQLIAKYLEQAAS
ncbi:DUF3445 domain-containing protein [uncultured Sneathiella sp.]|jgi:hypothetical protein|uniref:heme-dependent oxidative N-demethylase family protein n=1 Tax=uncultured Sneathiella sp. TaxID=879315 RepID=UPI0030DBF11A|tara:strand:+ start:14084 stop:14932 length:849 start_codon:yes stop_codon:yes gene_type:complete